MSEMISSNLAPEGVLAHLFFVMNYFSNKRKKIQAYIDSEHDPLYFKHIWAAFYSDKPNVIKSNKESGDDWVKDNYLVFTCTWFFFTYNN